MTELGKLIAREKADHNLTALELTLVANTPREVREKAARQLAEKNTYIVALDAVAKAALKWIDGDIRDARQEVWSALDALAKVKPANLPKIAHRNIK